MGTITRDQVVAPALPSVEVDVPEAGGTVRVTGLLLDARMAMLNEAREAGNDLDYVPMVLARTVVLDDGAPLYDVAGWRVFQAAHGARIAELFQVAMRMNGMDRQESQKN